MIERAVSTLERRALGQTGLACSPLGFGGYRIARGVDAHEAALRSYLESGGNLIDTSSNYGLGNSELLVGDVIKDFGRDDVIVVSKAGYIQGQNKIAAAQQGYSEIVKFAPDVWHCIHPTFLSDQLDMSCARLSVKRIDVYLLHNPEYFLKDRQNRGCLTDQARETFYTRIERVFEYFESEVKKGRLGSYGISSNSFGLPAGDASFVSLSRCLDLARGISKEHHFTTVQLPLNLFETGGALELNNEGQSVLQFCRTHKLGVLVNRPLNALVDGHIVRLAESDEPIKGTLDPQSALEFLRNHEESFKRLFDFPLMGGGLGTAGWFDPVVKDVPSIAEFHTAVRNSFTPAVNTWLLNADRALSSKTDYTDWRKAFGRGLDELMEAMEDKLSRELTVTTDRISSQLSRAGLNTDRCTLSQAALAVLLGLDGVSCVLNGMRSTEYVKDSLGALSVKLDSSAVLKSFATQTEADPK